MIIWIEWFFKIRLVNFAIIFKIRLVNFAIRLSGLLSGYIVVMLIVLSYILLWFVIDYSWYCIMVCFIMVYYLL